MMEADTSQSAESLAKCGFTLNDIVGQFAKYDDRFDDISTHLCKQLVSVVYR